MLSSEYVQPHSLQADLPCHNVAPALVRPSCPGIVAGILSPLLSTTGAHQFAEEIAHQYQVLKSIAMRESAQSRHFEAELPGALLVRARHVNATKA